MPQVSVLGMDMAKQLLHVVGLDDAGNVVWRKRCPRGALMSFLAQMPPVAIGMEACGGAHYWARRFREHGHTVRRMAPQFVNPSVNSKKNAMADAEASGEAVTRPTLRFVPIKELTPQEFQALHRVRERLVNARTALMNARRGWRGAYGIVLPQGVTKFRQGLLPKLEQAQTKLTARGRAMFHRLYGEWLGLEEPLASYSGQLEAMGQAHPVCRRLLTIPGLGPLTATALVAAVSDATHVNNGRQFAAGLGLMPRQHSTGGKPRLLAISQRGDRSRRKRLVHGARATLRWAKRKHDRRSRWGCAVIARRGTHRAVAALAHKNARIAGVLLTTAHVYTPERTTASSRVVTTALRLHSWSCQAPQRLDAVIGQTGLSQPWWATRPARPRLS